MPLETRGVAARLRCRAPGGSPLVVDPVAAHRARRRCATSLGLAEHQVRVIAPDVGGGFGVKQEIYPEEIVLAAAGRCGSRGPVKWIETRREHLTDGRSRARAVARRRAGRAARRHHRRPARRGARPTWARTRAASACSARRSRAASLPGPYRIRHYTCRVRVRPHLQGAGGGLSGCGPARGGLRHSSAPSITWRSELGMDPAELRRRNFIRPRRVPVGRRDRVGPGPGGLRQRRLRGGPRRRAGARALRRAARASRRPSGRRASAAGSSASASPLRAAHRARAVRGRGAARGRRPARRCSSPAPRRTVRARPPRWPRSSPTSSGLTPDDVDGAARRHRADPVRRRHLREPQRGRGGQRRARAPRRAVAAKARRLAAHLLEVDEARSRAGRWRRARVRGRAGSPAHARPARGGRCAPGSPLPAGMEPGLEATHYFQAPRATFASGVHIAVVEVDRETGQVADRSTTRS